MVKGEYWTVALTHLLAPYPTIEYDFPEPVCPYAKSEQLNPVVLWKERNT